MTAAILDLCEYRERLRNETLAECDALCNVDDVDSCDWCSVATLVIDLRDAGKLFDEWPGGEPMVGHVCPLCVQKEHELREREPGRYCGTEYEE